MRIEFSILLVSLIISSTIEAQHGMPYPVSMTEQEEVSELIVEGEVVNQYAEWNKAHNLIYTQ